MGSALEREKKKWRKRDKESQVALVMVTRSIEERKKEKKKKKARESARERKSVDACVS